MTAEKEGLPQGHFLACTKRPSKPITLLDQKITRIVNKEVSRVKLSVVVFILVVFLQMYDNRRVSEVIKILVHRDCTLLFSDGN